jgi:hypothetical protein
MKIIPIVAGRYYTPVIDIAFFVKKILPSSCMNSIGERCPQLLFTQTSRSFAVVK